MPGYGLADWVSALGRAGCHPRKSGDGWSARCPAHDDKHPSLTLCEGDTQPVVAKCHAGCEFEQVQAALGLDRWDGRPADLQVVVERPAKNRDHKPRQLQNGPGEQSWIYTDAAGAPLMAAVRSDYTTQDGKPGKKFGQWTPKGDGWIPIGMPKGKPKPLYRLPELAANPEARVVVVEGEKCVDAWRRVWPERLVTTWPGGCDQWHLGGSSETRNACIHTGLLVGALSGYPRTRQFLPTVGAKRHLFVWGLEGLGLGVWGQWRGCF